VKSFCKKTVGLSATKNVFPALLVISNISARVTFDFVKSFVAVCWFFLILLYLFIYLYLVLSDEGNFKTDGVQTGSGSQPSPIEWVPCVFSLGVKRPGGEADHSPPSSADVKNAWSYTSTPPVCLHGVMLS
jgi:hypothetical protein